MNISLDFDYTYTLDPELWNEFIRMANARGHTVYCITYRCMFESKLVYDTIGKYVGESRCFFTCSRSKRDYMREAGIEIDVWIDDTPDAIIFNEHPHEDDGVKSI